MNISLKELILGLNLDEGLIKSYPLDASIRILNRDKVFNKTFIAKADDKWLVVRFTIPSSERKLSITEINRWKKDNNMVAKMLDETYETPKDAELSSVIDLNFLLHKLNTLGYIPAHIVLYNDIIPIEHNKFSLNRLIKYIKDNIGKTVEVYFQQYETKNST